MFTDMSIQVKIKEHHRIMIHKRRIMLNFTPPYIPKNNVAAEDIFEKYIVAFIQLKFMKILIDNYRIKFQYKAKISFTNFSNIMVEILKSNISVQKFIGKLPKYAKVL